jgi:shikimate kinase
VGLDSERFVAVESNSGLTRPLARVVRQALGSRSIVLVGMMGSGKTSIGRRLALALDLPFCDADAEIEQAAGMTIEDIFRFHGEAYFREGEERVIRRLLEGGPQVLATGGGAVISEQTRAKIAKKGVSIWLNAPLDLLFQRVSRRDNRPLLKTDEPRAVLERLLLERARFYGAADLIFESRDAPHDAIVDDMLSLLAAHLAAQGLAAKHGTAIAGENESKP